MGKAVEREIKQDLVNDTFDLSVAGFGNVAWVSVLLLNFKCNFLSEFSKD